METSPQQAETQQDQDVVLQPSTSEATSKNEETSSFSKQYIWTIIFFIFQILIIVCIGLVAKFDGVTHPNKFNPLDKGAASTYVISSLYNSLKDVQVMVFIGFGCLYAYLRQYSVTSVGLNFILWAFTVEFSLIALTFWTWVFTDKWNKIEINLGSILLAVYAGATVLISLGGTIGKLSLPQYMLMVVLETIFCALNSRLGEAKLYTVDLGGSMNIHTFGAFFGVAMTWVMFHGDKAKMQRKIR